MKVIKDINTLVSAVLEVVPDRGAAGPGDVVHKLLLLLLCKHAEGFSKYR